MRPDRKEFADKMSDCDIAILRGLFESRVMSRQHVAKLYCDGRAEATKKRLQRLKASGLVGERVRHTFEPGILFLTAMGISFLRGRGILREYPPFSTAALENRAEVSAMTLRHELDVMDVKAAVCSAAWRLGLRVPQFTTWPLLNQFEAPRGRGSKDLVKPDGFFSIVAPASGAGSDEHSFFLELDRSTETQSVLAARAVRYLDHYRSGGFAVRRGGERADYKRHPFRVLVVLQTEQRRNNTSETLLRLVPPILTNIWLTTLRELEADPLGAIWIRPVDYRDGLKGTPFDVMRRRGHPTITRDAERERMVERAVRKRRLLE